MTKKERVEWVDLGDGVCSLSIKKVVFCFKYNGNKTKFNVTVKTTSKIPLC